MEGTTRTITDRHGIAHITEYQEDGNKHFIYCIKNYFNGKLIETLTTIVDDLIVEKVTRVVMPLRNNSNNNDEYLI